MASSSSLSALVRSSTSTVTEDDLDRQVAELILKEAKKKAEKYGQQGIRAYISSNLLDSNAPRANKRFLSSIIRSTDDHNRTILRAQALAAQEIKREREERERRERRLRAQEAADARRSHRRKNSRHHRHHHEHSRGHGQRSGSDRHGRRLDDGEEGWDRWDGRNADRSERRRKTRNWETWNGENTDEDDSHTDSKGKSRSREEDEDEDGRPRRRRRHNRSRTRSSSPQRTRDRERSRERHSRHRRSRRHDSRTPDREWERESRRDRKRHRRERSRRRHRAERASAGSRGPVPRGDNDESSESPRKRRAGSLDGHSSLSPPSERKRKRDGTPDDRRRRRSRSRPRERRSQSSPSSRSSSPEKRRKRDVSPTDKGRRRSKSLQDTEEHERDDCRLKVPSCKGAGNNSLAGRCSGYVESYEHSPETKDVKSKPDEYDTSSSMSMSRSSSPTPGPEAPTHVPSKMDKYFDESYDPRLDVAPLTVPQVPATGLINNAEYESWDAMLELIRLRERDREEKKRLERFGLLPKVKTKSRKGSVVISSNAASDRWNGQSTSIMDIEYTKRGTVREWDLGKDGAT
ncbi:hypothetical protein AX15_000693 [Amanita polypyramis BW_CC]|nr:hypothetical protein AX15_000693 [Amanita polypyramis BW_CC]